MSLDAFIFNGENFYLLHLNSSRGLDDITFSTRETFGHDSRYYLVIALEHLYEQKCPIGLISVEENFVRSFNNGIIRKVHLGLVKMYASKVLRTKNDSSYKLDYAFENDLPPILLAKNMDVKLIQPYLGSLRKSLIESDDDVDRWLKKHNVSFDIGPDPVQKLKKLIENLPNRVICAIARVISSNRLNAMVSPNIFYYNEMNKTQQSSLSIKSSSAADIDEEEEEKDKDEDKDSDTEMMDVDEEQLGNFRVIPISDLTCDAFGRPKITFSPGVHMYTFCSKYVQVICRLTLFQLDFVLQRFMIAAYSIENSSGGNRMMKQVKLVIDVRNFAEFQAVKFNKELIEYVMIDENFDADLLSGMSFSKNRTMVLQTGCPIFLGLVSFNTEQNAAKSKYVEVAARVCPHMLEHLCKHYGASFRVTRTMQRTDKYFTFYEVLFYVNKSYVEEILAMLYPNFSQQGCPHQNFVKASAAMKDARLANDKFATSFDACWMQVPCMYIHYHTFFNFFSRYISVFLNISDDPQNTFCRMLGVELGECANAVVKTHPLFVMAIHNYTMFEFMKETGTSSIASKDAGSIFANIHMCKVQMIERDIIMPFLNCELKGGNVNAAQRLLFRSLNVRYVEFSGLQDGPLIYAVSIRTCEQMRKHSSQLEPADYDTNVVNANMLVNNVQQSGQEAGQTDMFV